MPRHLAGEVRVAKVVAVLAQGAVEQKSGGAGLDGSQVGPDSLTRARKMLGSRKRCKLVHAFLWGIQL